MEATPSSYISWSGSTGVALSWLLQHVDHPIHLCAEIVLFICLIYLYTIKSYKAVDESLSQNEEEELIAEWQPEPLVSNENLKLADAEPRSPAIEGPAGPYVIEKAIECTDIYGVGACGPRGFYGSIQPHMDLEKKIAKFMQREEAVIFSSEFQTVASVIPAFSKPGDYLLCDKGVSFAVQNGMLLSRSLIKWFDHNNIRDLERILQGLSDTFRRGIHRVFILVESIYTYHGDIVNLREILDLKKKYPFRIIMDESFSLGVLGKTGRGITEHIGIASSEVDIITSSLGNAIGTLGGFACGTVAMGDHMRLNCNGYVFSCSSPPYLSTAAIQAITLVETSTEIKKLQRNITLFHETLKKHLKTTLKGRLVTPSCSVSPIIHLRLSRSTGSQVSDQRVIRTIADELYSKSNIVVAVSKYSGREAFMPQPSVKMYVSALHSEKDIVRVVECLASVVKEVVEVSEVGGEEEEGGGLLDGGDAEGGVQGEEVAGGVVITNSTSAVGGDSKRGGSESDSATNTGGANKRKKKKNK